MDKVVTVMFLFECGNHPIVVVIQRGQLVQRTPDERGWSCRSGTVIEYMLKGVFIV